MTLNDILDLTKRIQEQEEVRASIVSEMKEVMGQMALLDSKVSVAEKHAIYKQFDRILRDFIKNLAQYNDAQANVLADFKDSIFNGEEICN